ncbi:MAG TPA: sensor histidine kinase [Spirochaetales bacterium]|nr:sensor histidine kinase [Spirochaetales bacterium]
MQVTIALAFSIVSVSIIVAAIVIAYSVTEETARITSLHFTQQLVKQIANTIESYIEYMNSISAFVQADTEVQEFLTESDPQRKQLAGRHATEILKTLSQSRKDISLVAVFDQKLNFISHDENFDMNPFVDPTQLSWFQEAQKAKGNPVVSSSHVQNIIKDRYRWVISLSRSIDKRGSREPIGVLLVDLNYDVISRICSSVQLDRKGYIFILDKNGEIVYHPQQQLIFSGLKGENIRRILEEPQDSFSIEDVERDKFYSVQIMRSTGWKVVGVNYRSELVENRDQIRTTYAFWGLTFFSITILLSILLSRRISRPIKQLRKTMQKVEQGNFNVRATIGTHNEIGELSKTFNIMLSEIQKLVQRVTEQQELKRKSELKALQMQINPHFLYNTLDSIIWMAEGGKQQEVIAMSSSLARLFRLSISKNKEIIDIASEVEHVRNYLTIQKIRYKDKMDYRIEVPDEIKRYKTVKIILQPLVENAIYHGIKNKEGTGLIIISGRKTTEGVELIVQDDGVGMSAEALQQLKDTMAGNGKKSVTTIEESSNSLSSHSGLGVHNVDERIKLYFGNCYGLEYESKEDFGTVVRIRLPAVEEEVEG